MINVKEPISKAIQMPDIISKTLSSFTQKVASTECVSPKHAIQIVSIIARL